jgi:hypothetical protein
MLYFSVLIGDPSHQFRLAPPSGLSRHGAELQLLTTVPNKLLRPWALVGCKVPAFDKRSTVNTSANSVHNSRGISTSNGNNIVDESESRQPYYDAGKTQVIRCASAFKEGVHVLRLYR